MPVFTAIATAIVGYIGVTGLAATILTSVIATGLAMVTSRLINGNAGGGEQAQQQATGSRVQLSPSTENKIPVVYGEGYFPGTIVDAYLTNENKTMSYVMVIGETVNQNARFTASINSSTSRMTVTDAESGDLGTIMLGMTLRDDSGNVLGRVEEFMFNEGAGSYGGQGIYRVSSPVNFSGWVNGKFDYSVSDVYWNDLRLEFDSGANGGRALRGKKHVENSIYNETTGALNPEDFTDTNFDGKVEVYIYANNSTNTSQILGPTPAKPAYQVIGNGTQWTAPGSAGAERMEGLIFAVVKVNYDAEKGFTGIPAMTFKIKNSLDNPAVALFDYMRDVRYGAGISASSINAAALGDFANFCNELVTYTPYDSTSTTTQKRYTINGLIDTNRTVKDNIDTILMNAGAWMSYDVHSGQWRVIPKRGIEYTAAYPNRQLPAQTLRFTDDNIVGGIVISSTRLDDLYNAAEIEYFDKLVKDQRGYKKILVNESDRNYNEPDNSMRLTLDLCNSNVQAERVANLELKQSRDDLLVVFKATHYGLQAQAGDVIQLEQSLYGWSSPVFPGGKYFRVIKVKEIDGQDGMYAEITALEYNADVYTDEDISEFTTSSNIGIIPRASSVNIPAPIVELEGNKVNASGGVPNFRVKIRLPETGGPFDECQLWFSEGDDWAGLGGDLSFKGQAAGDKLYVITWSGPAVIRAFQNTPSSIPGEQGVATTISAKGLNGGTFIQAFGATNSPYYGNGLTGYYTLSEDIGANTGITTWSGTVNQGEFDFAIDSGLPDRITVSNVSGTVSANALIKGGVESATITSGKITGTTLSVFALTGTIVADVNTGTTLSGDSILQGTRITAQIDGTPGGVGTYTVNRSQGIPSIVNATGYYPNLLNDTVILDQLTGTTGGAGVYRVNKQQNFTTASGTGVSKYPYPTPASYQYLKSIKPDPGNTLLFDQNSLRETFISSLPENGLNKKYFVKARLGIAGEYGPFSELGEVDLEPAVVYWEPDSQSALNIKTELVKMDFGKFTIPRNGLWLMRTATQLDGGRLMTPTGDYFNMDLGDFREEHQIDAAEFIEDFRADPQDE
jgi:Putative phage tail protein